MSETPRTDAEFKLEAFFDGTGIVETVFVEFARQLESELAEARAEIERKNAIIGQMREALLLALPEARSTHVEQMILAALKAERGRVMGKAIDLLNERINWLEDEIHEMEKNSATAINNGKTGWSIAAGLLQHRERKMNALYELKAVLAEALK